MSGRATRDRQAATPPAVTPGAGAPSRYPIAFSRRAATRDSLPSRKDRLGSDSFLPPRTAGWNELHLAEDPAVELLESLGYTYVPPEALEPERASTKATILAGRLAAALKRLSSPS